MTMWKHACLVADPKTDSGLLVEPLLGVTPLARLLIALRRSGIETVFVDPALRSLCTETVVGGVGLPLIRDLDAISELPAQAPLLAVSTRCLLSVQLVNWVAQQISGGDAAPTVCVLDRQKIPVVAAFSAAARMSEGQGTATLDELCGDPEVRRLHLAPEVRCVEIAHLFAPGGERLLLDLVGKATDRAHVRWVRRRAFPLLTYLAKRKVTPNQVTWGGFLMALGACAIIAGGGYLQGIIGAALLYLSWVLDCIDGTLARLTFQESEAGMKLDTALGHLSNLAIYSALIWAVYGGKDPWMAAFMAVVILGGISVAYGVMKAASRLRGAHAPAQHGRLKSFLAKINHRDYAVVILVLAVFDAFPVFLVASAIGVHVFWLLQWLLLRRAHAGGT